MREAEKAANSGSPTHAHPGGLRGGALAIAQNLVVPHGFTLTIGGSVAVLVGERGYPGAFGICLFVAGANIALLACLAYLGGHRNVAARAVTGLAVFNIAPSLAVPAVYWLTEPMAADGFAYLAGGVMSVLLYVLMVGGATTIAALFPRRRQTHPTPRTREELDQ